MAFDFSKLNFFSKLNARARVLVLAIIFFGFFIIVFLATKFLGSSTSVGPSRVANAPSGLQSVQGGNLTPEYQQALLRANSQIAQQAQMTGGSAVPTVVNFNAQQVMSSNGQCIICSDQAANVKSDLDQWVSQGTLSPADASALQQLADKNVSVEDYAAELDRLVKAGKLKPEQARLLLDKYKKQHQNNLLKDSGAMMDPLIQSGSLPVDVATELLQAQKDGISPADYAAKLQELVKEGKISPEVAQQLLAQYTQQRAKEIVNQSVGSLRKMVATGEITGDVANELIDLENRMVPVDTYESVLNRQLTAGKMTPAAAKKILDEFKMQKAAVGPTGTANLLLQKAETAAYGELNDLLKSGKITQAVAAQLMDLIQRNVSLDEYQSIVSAMVQQKKLTPDIAKLKIADYQEVKGLREVTQRLGAMQGNNASPGAYAEELKKAVQAGVLTPDQAAELMQEYQAVRSGTITPSAAVAETAQLAQLQRNVEKGGAAQTVANASQFAVPVVPANQPSPQELQARLESQLGVMQGQAQQLVAAWQPVTMLHKEGTPETPKATTANATTKTGEAQTTSTTTTSTTSTSGAPIIKAGTILFGVLDTAINSDYPDSPVMVTIVDGQYKGAKLLGKITTTKSVSGQMDRVMLNFTLFNMDQWPSAKTVTAYAIDPDTARTVLASNVDYHYLKRFGAMMATSLLQGYGQAVMGSGGSSVTSAFGTSSTNPQLSPGNKVAVAIGQMGTALGQATQNYVNQPPTVRVDSGVGLGILFMADVT